MKALRILLVTAVYPPEIGGPSAQTRQLAKHLRRSGHEVLVVTYPAVTGDRLKGDGVVELRVPRLGGVRRSLTVYRHLAEIMVDFRPDVVHMQMADGKLALLTAVAARRTGTPTLVKYAADLWYERLHRDDAELEARRGRTWLKERFLRLAQARLLGLYDVVWATSPLFARRAVREFGQSSERVWCFPNLVDLERFSAVASSRAADRPVRVVLTAARLRPWKGIDTCITAFAAMERPDVELWIAGDDDVHQRRQLDELAARLGVADRVRFLGAVPPVDMPGLYAQADVFVLASRYEPFGIVLVEAMAAGVPIVATAVDGIPSVVDNGRSARLVPPGNAGALSRELRRLVDDPGARSLLASTASKSVSRFDMARGLHSLVETYAVLVDGKRLPLTGSDVDEPDERASDAAPA